MPAGILVWFAGGPGWVFTAALGFSLLSGVEQIAIASVMPRSRTGVPTVWHAWRFRREASAVTDCIRT